MTIVERHTSPDGLLQLIIELADDGDWSVGFDGFQWHTHETIEKRLWNGQPISAERIIPEEETYA